MADKKDRWRLKKINGEETGRRLKKIKIAKTCVPDDVEQRQRDESLFSRQNVVLWIGQDECCEGGDSDEDGSAREGEMNTGEHVQLFAQDLHLVLANARQLFDERRFPSVEFEDFDAVEHLVHEFDATIFKFHVGHLKLPRDGPDEQIEGYKGAHDGEARHRTRAQLSPQHIHGDENHERRRPEEIQRPGYLHELLRVYRLCC